jgi:hypothetical protein
MINESIVAQGSLMIESDLFKSLLTILFGLIATFFISRFRKYEYKELQINESILDIIKKDSEIIEEDKILIDAYRLFRNQCKVSFNFGLAFATISFFFLLLTIGFLLFTKSADLAGVSTVAGGLTSFASAIGFYLYHKSSSNHMALVYESIHRSKEKLNSLCSSTKESHEIGQIANSDSHAKVTSENEIEARSKKTEPSQAFQYL